EAADVRQRHPDVGDGPALRVLHLARRAVHLENRTRGCVGHLRADGLRADFGAALESGPGLYGEPHDVIQRHLVLAADRAPEVRLLALALPDPALDRPRLRAIVEAPVEPVLRDLWKGVEDRQHLRE